MCGKKLFIPQKINNFHSQKQLQKEFRSFSYQYPICKRRPTKVYLKNISLFQMPLTSKCPIEQGERTKSLIMELFRALHHPYIYPVLDLELCNGHALTVLPFNARGSLKDLIYKVLNN